MSRRIIFAREAESDIAEFYAWYEDQAPGFGEEFLRCVGACIETLQRNPFLYRVAVDAFHRALVRRFPFEVFYEITDKSIVVYSVFHCSQEPGKWHRRLERK